MCELKDTAMIKRHYFLRVYFNYNFSTTCRLRVKLLKLVFPKENFDEKGVRAEGKRVKKSAITPGWKPRVAIC